MSVSTNGKKEETCHACDGDCDCYDGTIDEKKAVQAYFYILFEEYKKRLFGLDASFIVEKPSFHNLEFTGELRNEFIEDPSTEDKLVFIGDSELIDQFIDEINPLYQPSQGDFHSHTDFKEAGGGWEDGDFVFFITLNAQGKWAMSGGEYSPTKNFH